MLKRSRLEDSPLSLAKRAFRQSSIPSVLVSREDHIHQIQLFWENHVKARKCNSMYVSGCPGTGKTAIVNHVLDQKQADDSRITIVNINCMHLSSPNSIHLQILTQLGITSTLKNSLSHLTQTVIQDSPIKKNSRVYLVVLDEIDHLVTNNANLLCSLFELCKQKNSRICIIGIANQIDLIDRFLSVPILLPFHPYTSEEIALIIKSRLPDQENSIFTPNAIELLSKKLVGLGDIRKTLDICLKSIEKMESDDKKSIVDFNHVLAVTKSTIGNTNTSINKIKELNFHVQVCLVSCFRGSINNVRSVGSITDCYYKFVKMGKVGGISRNEFGVVLTVLEGLGLIILGNAKEERERLVELCVSEEEVREGCRGHEKALFYMDVKI